MSPAPHPIVGKVLLVSAIVMAALAAFVLGGLLPVDASVRNIIGLSLFAVAAADGLVALIFFTRS
jgi:hypothetical protein